MRAAAGLVIVAACGRVGFDARAPSVDDAPAPDAVPVSCTSGAAIAPIAAIDASLSDPLDACAITNALALDGQTAGLDRGATATCPSTWSSSGSCGCVAVDLGAVYAVSRVSAWAAWTAQACASPCGAGQCGTGHAVDVLVGTTIGNYTLASNVTLVDASISQYDVTFATPGMVRYVVACRQSWSADRDDVVIDYLNATCQ